MTALICAYDIYGDGAAQPLAGDQVAGPIPDGAWRWVNLMRTEPDAADILASLGLTEAAIDPLLVEETRPRAWNQGDRTLMVLRGINLNEDIGDHPLIALRLSVSKRMVITCRKFRFMALEDLMNRCESGEAPPSPAAFVVDLIEGLSERFAARITELDTCLEEIEGHQGEAREEGLAGLRRDLLPLARFMLPQREALSRLRHLSQAWASTESLADIDDVENEFLRLIEHLREVEGQATLLREELLAETAATQARNTYLISILAALFVPLSFITGLLGMNVAGIPGAETPYAFALVVGLMAAVFVAGLAVLRWRRWI
ncbi:MAG: CorA family divalent cation transporter [Thalassobaculum sp.]